MKFIFSANRFRKVALYVPIYRIVKGVFRAIIADGFLFGGYFDIVGFRYLFLH